MRSHNDPQAELLYAVEDAVFPPAPVFTDIRDVVAFVLGVTTSPTWKAVFGKNILVIPSDEFGFGVNVGARVGYIFIPPTGMYPAFVLHELAHTITPPSEPDHGPQFCTNLLHLLLWTDKVGYDKFRAALRDAGVDCGEFNA